MKTHASKLVDQIATERIAPILKPLGYRKAGLTWRKVQEPVVRLVQAQKSAGNTHASAMFTLNIGLFHPDLYSELEATQRPSKITMEHCRPQTRMDAFEGGNDHWWEIDASNAEDIGADVANIVKTHVVPWLENANSLEDMLDRLVEVEDFFPAAVVSWLLGKDDAGQAVERAVQQIEPLNARFADRIRKWATERSIAFGEAP